MAAGTAAPAMPDIVAFKPVDSSSVVAFKAPPTAPSAAPRVIVPTLAIRPPLEPNAIKALPNLGMYLRPLAAPPTKPPVIGA